jgi:hypothetical protein
MGSPPLKRGNAKQRVKNVDLGLGMQLSGGVWVWYLQSPWFDFHHCKTKEMESIYSFLSSCKVNQSLYFAWEPFNFKSIMFPVLIFKYQMTRIFTLLSHTQKEYTKTFLLECGSLMEFY